jgi:hypothetical protein
MAAIGVLVGFFLGWLLGTAASKKRWIERGAFIERARLDEEARWWKENPTGFKQHESGHNRRKKGSHVGCPTGLGRDVLDLA